MEPLARVDQRVTLVGAAACWIGALALAVVVRVHRRPFTIDRLAFGVVEHRLFGIPIVPYALAARYVRLGDNRDFIVALGVLVAASLLVRDRFAIATCPAPAVALTITEALAKPLVGRYEGHVYAFPSGHATAISAIAMQGAILCYRRWGRRSIIPVGLGLGLATAFAILAIVRTQIHVLSDAIGGVLIGFGTALAMSGILSVALVRARAPGIRSRPS